MGPAVQFGLCPGAVQSRGRFLSREGNAQIWVAKLGLAARWGLACWEKEGGRQICRREWWPGSGGGSGDGEKGTDLRLVEGNGTGLGAGLAVGVGRGKN